MLRCQMKPSRGEPGADGKDVYHEGGGHSGKGPFSYSTLRPFAADVRLRMALSRAADPRRPSRFPLRVSLSAMSEATDKPQDGSVKKWQASISMG